MAMVTFKNDASLNWNLGMPANADEVSLKAAIGKYMINYEVSPLIRILYSSSRANQ